jgi:hypothetical protein
MTQPALPVTNTTREKQQHTMTAPQITIWGALEESRRIQLLKYLAELIRRAKESQTIEKGGTDELR